MITVTMPYIGCHLSENYYKIVGRLGVKTNKTRPDVIKWMGELTDKVRGFYPGTSLVIYLSGKFYDDRAPDLANLHKVIGDAIKKGVCLDDKSFKFVDEGYTTGYSRPELVMKLEGNSELLSETFKGV